MMKLFKPEDFIFPETMSAAYLPDRAASLANEILQREVEKWPVVYGGLFISNDKTKMETGSVWNTSELRDHTHTARLAFIEEIKKEPCKENAVVLWPVN